MQNKDQTLNKFLIGFRIIKYFLDNFISVIVIILKMPSSPLKKGYITDLHIKAPLTSKNNKKVVEYKK
jgi:hypothetical protein